jgi:hypothetical protein
MDHKNSRDNSKYIRNVKVTRSQQKLVEPTVSRTSDATGTVAIRGVNDSKATSKGKDAKRRMPASNSKDVGKRKYAVNSRDTLKAIVRKQVAAPRSAPTEVMPATECRLRKFFLITIY